MNPTRVVFAGDSTLVVQFDERIDVVVNERVAALARTVAGAHITGVRDIVPTFRTLGVYFDPVGTDVDQLEEFLRDASAASNEEPNPHASEPDLIRVPVEYGGEAGPDLDDVARFAGVEPEEVIALHCARTYRVFMLGFVPGFAYLAPVDERIAMPRLDTPRTRVPAGSVGIAGVQTGIYPAQTPGGWRLIGRTTTKPFDLARLNPFLFRVGDRVQFYAERSER